jgi:hypothetical protein
MAGDTRNAMHPGARFCPTVCPIRRGSPIAKPNQAGIIIRVAGVRVPPPALRQGPAAAGLWLSRAVRSLDSAERGHLVATAGNRYEPPRYVHLCGALFCRLLISHAVVLPAGVGDGWSATTAGMTWLPGGRRGWRRRRNWPYGQTNFDRLCCQSRATRLPPTSATASARARSRSRSAERSGSLAGQRRSVGTTTT